MTKRRTRWADNQHHHTKLTYFRTLLGKTAVLSNDPIRCGQASKGQTPRLEFREEASYTNQKEKNKWSPHFPTKFRNTPNQRRSSVEACASSSARNMHKFMISHCRPVQHGQATPKFPYCGTV